MAGTRKPRLSHSRTRHLAADRLLSALTFTQRHGAVHARHGRSLLVLGLGIAGLIATFFGWFSNIVKEAQRGDHTPVVQLHMRYGMILFIASEVMFFVGWFWAGSTSRCSPAEVARTLYRWRVAARRRSRSARSLLAAAAQHADPAVLGHHGDLGAPLAAAWRPRRADEGPVADDHPGRSVLLRPGLRVCAAPFAFGGNTYSSAFYMATGFHGFHVLVGTIFLIVCLLRAYQGPLHPAPAFRLRSRGLVLALRRRGVAVPVHRRLCLGRLGRTRSTDGAPVRRTRIRAAFPPCSAGSPFSVAARAAARRTLFAGVVKFAPRCRPAGSISTASMSATGLPRFSR